MDTSGAVVVTGGASGLGRVVAETLLKADRPVVLVDADAEALDRTADELGARHAAGVAGIAGIVADLSTREGAGTAADRLLAEHQVAGLVNNAGGWSVGEHQFPTADTDRWLAAITLNLVTPMLLTQRLWPALAARGGAVVTIGSSGGVGDEPYGSPEYGAAKAAVARFTTSLGGRTDVRVTCVVPGWIGLDRAHAEWAALSADEQRRVGALIPPSAVADAVVALLDDGRPGEVVQMLHAGERSSSLD